MATRREGASGRPGRRRLVGGDDGQRSAPHAADDGGGVRASGEARCEFSMPNVLAPKESEDHEGEQLDLVLAELWEVRGEAAGQLGQDIGGRVLFSRVSRTFSSPSGKCLYVNNKVRRERRPQSVCAERLYPNCAFSFSTAPHHGSSLDTRLPPGPIQNRPARVGVRRHIFPGGRHDHSWN